MEFPPKIVVDLESEILNAIAAPGVLSRSFAAQRVLSRYFDRKVQGTLDGMDCKKGCSYCCSISVSAWPMEIFSIAEHVREQKDHKMLGNLNRFANRLRRAALEGEESRWQKRRLCPFLFDGSCSIYAVRPLTCRTWMVPKVERCREAFNGSDENVPYPTIPLVFQSICNGAVTLAGMHLELEMRLYKFIDAMACVLSEGLTERSFFDREAPFSGVPEDTSSVTKEQILRHAVEGATFLADCGLG